MSNLFWVNTTTDRGVVKRECIDPSSLFLAFSGGRLVRIDGSLERATGLGMLCVRDDRMD
jgi:hypothetical protein